MDDLEQRAKTFAHMWHSKEGQVRKYTGEPYIYHPAAVVELVRSVPHTPQMLAAAWLHDCVEDTGASLADIEKEFGEEVTDLVEMLTDVSIPTDGNRAARRAIDRGHTSRATPEAMTVKLADLIDNTRDIVAYDPKFADVYLAEKTELLKVLKEGDPTLLQRATEQVDEALAFLMECNIT